jgi:hypothetical protein
MKTKVNILLIVLASILIFEDTSAQFSFTKRSQKAPTLKGFIPYSSIGFGGGHTHYNGELVKFGTPGDIFRNIRWNGSVDYTRYFTRKFSARLGFSYARLFGDDNNFTPTKDGFLYTRNFHFRNDVKEFSLVGMLNLIDRGKDFKRRPNGIRPYLFAGIAIFAHDPQAKAPAEFGGGWERLQPLSTEGQGLPGYNIQPYSLVQVAVPFGVGFKYKITERLDVSAEIGIRTTFTDYLDNVGGTYPDLADLPSDLARAMANRSLEPFGAYSGNDRKASLAQFLNTTYGFPLTGDPFAQPIPGLSERGDQSGSPIKKDSYVLSVFKINYIIASKDKCPSTN